MKKTLFIVFMIYNLNMSAQSLKPVSISISYFGESITHLGIKAGITYNLYSWDKNKTKKNLTTKVITKDFSVNPYLGTFYHKRYQTALFILPEISYSRRNEKGSLFGLGIGGGYMRTFIPSVYEETTNGEFRKVMAGYNYLLTNYFIVFGRSLKIKDNTSLGFFIKPQVMVAFSANKSRTGYISIEAGINYKLQKK